MRNALEGIGIVLAVIVTVGLLASALAFLLVYAPSNTYKALYKEQRILCVQEKPTFSWDYKEKCFSIEEMK